MRNLPIHGRGAAENPPNRFERLSVSREAWTEEEDPDPETKLYRDDTRSVLATNDSPDVPFEVSLNPYRGCEHGCVYCYARPTHEYLGLSAGLDFETRIFVKEDAPALLREELEDPSWEPKPVAMSGVTDPYQPAERRLEITRGCLEVLAEFRNPVGIVTKSRLVTRDRDLLAELAEHDAARVNVSVTTLDEDLKVKMEPRAPAPGRRLDAIEQLAGAGVPVGVLVAPVIPGLTDHEIPEILSAVADAGASHASYVLLRLPHGVSDLFERWLERHFPDRKDRVLNRIRDTRGGRLNDPRFGSRMSGEGPFARQISEMFEISARRHGLDGASGGLSTDAFRRPTTGGGQVEMFAERA